jgi:hypothetical protein
MEIILTTLLLLFTLTANAQVSFKPTLNKENSTICADAQDRFLCEALEKAKLITEQLVNCEVVQTYTPKSWEDIPMTNKPNSYYVRIEGGKETYQRIKSNGKLAQKSSHPDYQSVNMYATSGWYEKIEAICKKGIFKKDTSPYSELVTYSFVAPKALSLSHTELWTTSVDSTVEGTISFDRKSKLLRELHYTFRISEAERQKHKFNFVEEEIVLGNPEGFEEEQPVPVSFWSKMQVGGTKVKIQVDYKNYRLFKSDVTFGSVEEINNENEFTPNSVGNFALNLQFLNRKVSVPAPAIKGYISDIEYSVSEIYSRLREITFPVTVGFWNDKGKISYNKCTAFLYQKKRAISGIDLYFLTNEHCTTNFAGAKLDAGNETLDIRRVFRLTNDVSVLLAHSDNVRWGNLNTDFPFGNQNNQMVYTVGFPKGTYTENQGKAVDKLNAEVNNSIKVIQSTVLSMQSNHGASGSPVFDANFKLVGVRFSQVNRNGSNYSLCDYDCSHSLMVDGSVVYQLLKSNNLIDR